MAFNLETENEDILQATTASEKNFQWWLNDGQMWFSVDNDNVIECHYCHPGAKGISINSSFGPLFIDFDTFQTSNPGITVQRQRSPNQTEDIGWYFRDDVLWREYGSNSFSTMSSTLTSKEIELQFSLNPQGGVNVNVGSNSYNLDFSSMTQKNLRTGMQRVVRRRPKLNNSFGSSSVQQPSASSVDGGFKWEFLTENSNWAEYQAHECSWDSAAIESQYQLNPQGQIHFKVNRQSYTLDFAGMFQVNNIFGTRRTVRRVQRNNSSGSLPRWEFQDANGRWVEYVKNLRHCSVSSQDIELGYQNNPSGTMTFNTSRFSYEIDFAAMTQKNLTSNTVRSVRRSNQ